MYHDLIEQFERGGEKLAMAIRGLSREDLTCFPIPGKWSIQQVVIHLMDSDLIACDRMKRTIAEPGRPHRTLSTPPSSLMVSTRGMKPESARKPRPRSS